MTAQLKQIAPNFETRDVKVREMEGRMRDNFRKWLEDAGHRLNPEGFQYAIEHRDSLSDDQFMGMNLWMNDFRRLFGID